VHNAADGAANEARIACFQALNQPPKADLTKGGTECAWDDNVVVGRAHAFVEKRVAARALHGRDLWLGFATEQLRSVF